MQTPPSHQPRSYPACAQCGVALDPLVTHCPSCGPGLVRAVSAPPRGRGLTGGLVLMVLGGLLALLGLVGLVVGVAINVTTPSNNAPLLGLGHTPTGDA